MSKLFLYRLYHHSRVAFILTILFIFLYVVLFLKKMDMVLFPYNNMFALSANNNSIASTYGMKLNGNKILFTNRLYWKKDFLETSVSTFGFFVQNNNKVFLNNYLEETKWPKRSKSFFEKKLTPHFVEMWPIWYCNFAGYTVPSNATIELYKYRIDYNESYPKLIDSSLVYRINTP